MTEGHFPKTRWTANVQRRAGLYDGTLQGMSYMHDTLDIVRIVDHRFDIDGTERWHNPVEPYDGSTPATLVIQRSQTPYWHLEPYIGHLAGRWHMFGGNYADLGWQFDEVIKRLGLNATGPGRRIVGIHDRHETH